MKIFSFAFALAMGFATAALGGDLAVSETTLDRMGLGAMQPMSDHDGLAVRGKGLFEDLLGLGFPEFNLGNTPPPASNTPPLPESPFDSSPFGGQSLLGNFHGGSLNFGSGPSAGGNTFGFGGSFPWPL